jgi:bacteriophage N4 adsorption protein B
MDLHYPLWLFFRYLLIALIFIYFLGGINEMVIDLFYYFNRIYRRLFKGKLIKPLTRAQLNSVPEKTMAIMLPAWNEGVVIRQMLLNTLGTVDYKNYFIFIGTYPNDRETREAVEKVQEIYPQLIMAVNPQDGPTNKADCLNVIHAGIRAFENEKGIKFDILILHDAEDVVHPLSLKLYNYLMPRMSMIQLPVLPLEAHWYQFTRGVYMDEFAELHLKEMLTREKISSALPSAGVGTAFIHDDLEFFGRHDGAIFNPQTITEDYEIGMRLSRHGKRSIILHQFLERIVTKKKWFGRGERRVKVKDLIATREYFPKHFWKAVKQRARWTYGISIQGWRNLKWDRSIGRNYFLLNDRRSIFANIFNFLGYFVFLYWIAIQTLEYFYASFVSPPLIQKDEVYWKLAVVVLFFFLWKIINRAITVYRLYGGVMAGLSMIRIFHGNLVNFFAAVMAIRWYINYRISGKEPGWIQTEHQYPTDQDLQLFRRKLGDLLLENQLITSKQLEEALAVQKYSGGRLGEILVKTGHLKEQDLSDILGVQQESREKVSS